MASNAQTLKNAKEIAKRAAEEALIGKFRQGDYSILSPSFAGQTAANAAVGLAKGYYDYQKGNVGKIVDWINSEDGSPASPASPTVAAQAPRQSPAGMVSQSPAPIDTSSPSQQALVGQTLYQDRNGNEVSPNSAGPDFMQRSGAFTGPSNDPETLKRINARPIDPDLTPFSPDDARFAKRNIEIALQQKNRENQLAQEASDREAERLRIQEADRVIARKREEEDRKIQQEINRKAQEYLADQQRRVAEEAERAAQWSAAHQGMAPTVENQKAVFEIENRNNNIQNYVNDHQYLSRLESQVPVIFSSLASGQNIDLVPPEILSFVQQSAPNLMNMPADQRGATLREIQKDLMKQIKNQKDIAAVVLQQKNKQNFPRENPNQIANFLNQ